MDNSRIAKTIAYLRKSKSYTQKDLADKLGISDKAVSKWERGLGIPDVSLLARLSILLDTDIESLLEGNVSHHKQNWVGLLLLDNEGPEFCGKDDIFAGTLIYDKPMVYYMISYYMLVGIKDILIVCSQESGTFIRNKLQNGDSLGIHIECVNRTMDSKETITKKVTGFTTGRNVAIINGYQFLYGIDLTKFMQRAMANPKNASVLVLPNSLSGYSKKVFYDSNRKILGNSHKLQEDQLENYYSIPFLFCSAEALHTVEYDWMMSYDELYEKLIERELLYAELIGRGMFSLMINGADEALVLSEFIHMIQKTQYTQVASLEEIAWRRGLIRKNNLKQ